MTNLQLELICSIVIPKKHHKIMIESKTYTIKIVKQYKKQIENYINKSQK